MKLSPFSNSLKKIKELFDLIISKISFDGGDFPSIIEIALFENKNMRPITKSSLCQTASI